MKTYVISLLVIVLVASLGGSASTQEGRTTALADSAIRSDLAAEDAINGSYRSWTPLILLSVFILLILIPFLPGLIEMSVPKDRYPLPVKNTKYAKDPRYLGTSARRILTQALEGNTTEEGRYTIMMSKEETVDVTRDKVVPMNERVRNVQYVRGDLRADAGVRFLKEVFVCGEARIGPKSWLRSLACDGPLTLGDETRVARWLDAEGEITVGNGCDLGVSVASAGGISLGDRVQFKRLFGNPVTTSDYLNRKNTQPSDDQSQKVNIPSKIRSIKDTLNLYGKDLILVEGQELIGDVVVKGDLTCKKGSCLKGSAKVYGTFVLEKDARISGDIFCEGPVTVGEGAVVSGNIFSQDAVIVLPGARLGREGALKSVIGKKEVRIAQDVCIHGYVLTEGQGRIESKSRSGPSSL